MYRGSAESWSCEDIIIYVFKFNILEKCYTLAEKNLQSLMNIFPMKTAIISSLKMSIPQISLSCVKVLGRNIKNTQDYIRLTIENVRCQILLEEG